MNTTRPSIDVVCPAAINEARLVEQVGRVVEFLAGESQGYAFSRISIRVVDDAEMSMLHLKYSKVAGTTDVLTFVEEDPNSGIAVDLAICIDEARRCASELHHSVDDELALYMVHGLLHALGFDDSDGAKSTAMHAEEDRILTSVGIGAVYGARERKP